MKGAELKGAELHRTELASLAERPPAWCEINPNLDDRLLPRRLGFQGAFVTGRLLP